MKEQNSPIKKEEVLKNQTNGKPFFRSPLKRESTEGVFARGDGTDRNRSPSGVQNSHPFTNSYYHPENNLHESRVNIDEDDGFGNNYSNPNFGRMTRNE